MPATLLVLDIDGTLRPHGEPRVPKENVDALRTVQKAGVKLVIATGRCRAEIPAKMLRGIRPDYWICAAGAQVEDAAGTALYTSHMTAEEMYALVDFCEDYEHPLGFSFSDGGYVYLDYEAFHVQEKAAALEGCLKDGEDQDRHLLDMPFSAFGMLAAEDIAKFQAKYAGAPAMGWMWSASVMADRSAAGSATICGLPPACWKLHVSCCWKSNTRKDKSNGPLCDRYQKWLLPEPGAAHGFQ